MESVVTRLWDIAFYKVVQSDLILPEFATPWFASQPSIIIMLKLWCRKWGTGIGGLMRGMATLPQGNQELLVVRDKVGRPQVSLG